MDNYLVEKVQLDQLTRSHVGLYSEMTIINTTDRDVAVVDSQNNRYIVPTVGTFRAGKPCVTVFLRQQVGVTRTLDNKPTPIAGIRVCISPSQFHTEPVYIKEANIIIANVELIDTVTHPCAEVEYEAAFSAIVDDFKTKTCEHPTFYAYANDPTGRCTALYTVMSSHIIKIPVTSMAGESKLYITYNLPQGPTTVGYGIDKLFDSDCDILEISDSPIWFISTNKTRAERHNKDNKRFTQSEVTAQLKQLEMQHARIVDNLNTAAALAATEKDQTIRQTQTQLKDVKHELEQMTAQYATLKGDLDYKAERRKDVVTEKVSENKLKESELKLWHVFAAAAVPAAAVAAIKVIEMVAKKKALEMALASCPIL